MSMISMINVPPSLESLTLTQQAVYTEITKGVGGAVVIMGTGHLGRTLAARLNQFPVIIECFCDNNPAIQGTVFMGRPVLSVSEAVKTYSGRAAFLVGIYHSAAAQDQLKGLGCEVILTAATLCRHFGPPLTPLASIDLPTAIYTDRGEVERCAEIWADEKSRSEYANVLHWFMATGQETLGNHDPASETYFPKDLWTENEHEHFVDCGAFDGDSVIMFLKKNNFKFNRVTAYEPDPRNLDAFEANMEIIPEEHRAKIMVINAAVGAKSSTLHFSVSGTAGSSVDDEGDLEINCIALDDQHCDFPPTFLKMDIEGYELEALSGGRAMIAKYAPILAITTYHKVEHLWQIPLLIHSFRPDYKFYLRRYAEDCWETVCYAVPPVRQTTPEK